MHRSKDGKHFCPAAHDVPPHGSDSYKTTSLTVGVKQSKPHLFSMTLGAKLSSGIMFANQKIIPVRQMSGDLNIPSVYPVCTGVFLQRFCCCQRCDTLFIPELRGGRHRNCTEFCNWLKRNPQRLSVMWARCVCVSLR